MAAAQLMTAEEFMALPQPTDATRAELIAGELVLSSPALLHQAVFGNLFMAVAGWTEAGPSRGRAISPIDVLIDDANVFAPDLLWYGPTKTFEVRSPPPYPLPDLAVEVRSPATWRYDIGAKKSAYERHGLPELWLVDTAAEQLLAFRRRTPATVTFDVSLELSRGEILESPLLPGFALALDIFDVD